MVLALLETAAAFAFHNLTIVVLDNECYGEAGEQASHTAGTVDFVGIAKSRGIPDSHTMARRSRPMQRRYNMLPL